MRRRGALARDGDHSIQKAAEETRSAVANAVVAGKDGDGTDGRDRSAGMTHVSGSAGGRFSNLPTMVGGSRDQFAHGLFVNSLYFPNILLHCCILCA